MFSVYAVSGVRHQNALVPPIYCSAFEVEQKWSKNRDPIDVTKHLTRVLARAFDKLFSANEELAMREGFGTGSISALALI